VEIMMLKKIDNQMRVLCVLLIAIVFLLAGCNMPGSNNKAPATPTVGVQIPLVTVAATDIAVEVIESPAEEDVAPTATMEAVEEVEEVVEEAAQPTATNTPEPVEVVEEAKPTFIPTNSSANPDATVFFHANTNCYVNADTESLLSGVASAGSALGALDRVGNFYQVNHPTKAGVLCWVTGSGISPNGAAFRLGD
jgi:hypothetical protein